MTENINWQKHSQNKKKLFKLVVAINETIKRKSSTNISNEPKKCWDERVLQKLKPYSKDNDISKLSQRSRLTEEFKMLQAQDLKTWIEDWNVKTKTLNTEKWIFEPERTSEDIDSMSTFNSMEESSSGTEELDHEFVTGPVSKHMRD